MKMSFRSYIEKMHSWFSVDKSNEAVVDLLSLYAKKDKEFEACKLDGIIFQDQQQLYLEKGLLLIGNVGTGKTELLKMLNRYYAYTGMDRMSFRIKNIPELADDFSLSGRAAFQKILKGNWMFDELCFIDEKTGKPDREYAMNYGDKILIGQKVIYDRYNSFIEDGWHSMFTTNANTKQIKEVYGERIWSRLVEMCNIIVYTGSDRRKNSRPHFVRDNKAGNVIEVPAQKKAADVKDDKEYLIESYNNFIVNGQWIFIYEFEYDKLISLGCQLGDLNYYITNVATDYPREDITKIRRMAKQLCVAKYYSDVKEGKVKSFIKQNI